MKQTSERRRRSGSMRYLALAIDYDGTLGRDGHADPEALRMLRELKLSGRKLILVTGRELEDLLRVFREVKVFDLIVAENGALIHDPASNRTRTLADPVPRALSHCLKSRGVPVSVGHVLLATHRRWDVEVLRAIGELGLELHVVFNEGAVMVLPPGINKASGLDAALSVLGVSIHNTVGIGNAENDHLFLSACECGVAVSGALPMLKDRADVVLEQDNGSGVAELCARLLSDDLESFEPQLLRRHLPIGELPDGAELRVPYGSRLLVTGASGSGKSSLVSGFVYEAMEQGYQCCVIDPEGEYESSRGLLVVGDASASPKLNDICQVLQQPGQSVAVSLLQVPMPERPEFFAALVPALADLRRSTGSPHWIIVDEANHVMPRGIPVGELAGQLINMLIVTMDPAVLGESIPTSVDIVLVAGGPDDSAWQTFCRLTGTPFEQLPQAAEAGQHLYWSTRDGTAQLMRPFAAPGLRRRRHRRKYADGDVGERSFYFRGPVGALNLRCKNLARFTQVSEGIDDHTWMFHLRRHDYSQWFRNVLKDQLLAEETERIESHHELSAAESRDRVAAIIKQHYVLPPTQRPEPLSAPVPASAAGTRDSAKA